MGMKQIITTLVITSSLVLAACNKTNKADSAIASTSKTQVSEIEVNVELDECEYIVMVNGEEQVIDLSQFFNNVDLENTNGQNIHMEMIVNGEEVNGFLPGDMMEHVMQMISSGDNADGMKSRMMMGGKGGPHQDRGNMDDKGRPHRDRGNMDDKGRPHRDRGNMEEHMVIRIDGDSHEMNGEWRSGMEHDVQEEVQFMEELQLLGAVAESLDGGNSVALMGIHMIRDELEGEVQLSALNAIIEEAGAGTAIRNAALIVAIQALKEIGDDEAAADLLVELVLSN
jgi:hypothetical protein